MLTIYDNLEKGRALVNAPSIRYQFTTHSIRSLFPLSKLCVCGRICNRCGAPQQHHIYGHTHTIFDFNQFYELLNEF